MSVKQRVIALMPYAELLAAVAAAVFWYRQGKADWQPDLAPGPWPFLLLGGMWISYWIRTGFRIRLSAVDILLSLFIFSAWIGTRTAYDTGPAWAKFWLLVGAWGIYYAFVHQPDRQHLYGVLACCGLFGAALTGYYFLTNDWWATHPVKIPALIALSQAISSRLPQLPARTINPNIIGGFLAMVLPFYVPLITLPQQDGETIP
ncbi:MAG: hypothetical protein P1S60_10490, partial [Anaerolineae bacterium]|nr:hypothetical protein [Anaerolineae bacterium]